MDSEGKFWFRLWATIVALVVTLVITLVCVDVNQQNRMADKGLCYQRMLNTERMTYLPCSADYYRAPALATQER